MNDSRREPLAIRLQELMAGVYRRTTHGQAALLALTILVAFPSLFAQTPITNGYRDFNYGSTVFEAPTADKPQSKLWWNDGIWWGVLWNPSVNKYRIHRFNLAAQSWIDVGPDVDDRSQSLADALWDGQKLYIASHVYSGGSQTSGNASAANSARLYRYSYNAVTDAYSLDAGFPVLINSAICEALVIDKDSLGRLWATWTQSSKVYINHSLNDDLTWRAPFALPTQGANLSSDDISTLMAYDGKIGVAWSNQSDNRIYFSFHQDNKADTDWEPLEIALSDPSLGAVADDHVNMKMTNDGGGNLYITTKTSLSGSNPGIYLLKRSFGGAWAKYVMATNSDNYTRPIVVIDDENRELYVFGKSGSNVYMKKTGLDNINFPTGVGTPFIRSSSGDINDPTVSKHNVNGTTGLLVLASDEVNRYYYHNYIALPSNGPATISSFSPVLGPAGTVVTITGANFNGVASVKFNGMAATNFAINSSAQITATVPVGATTGLISVTKTNGTAFSTNDFTVTTPVQYALTVNVAGFGSVNPSGGFYNSGTMVTLTATPAAGYQFSGWSGDLTGAANPATITMNADKNITATFAPSNASGTQVAFEEAKTGSVSKSTTVATSANLTGVSGQLYLAAISTKDNIAVTSVAGLGLNWTLVKAQCAGRNNTGVEVWMAQGIPQGGSNGAVTATFAARASDAVIAVSRYSGVDAVNPLGNIFSGNTNGVNGACSGGSDNKLYSFNLATIPQSGTMVYGAAAMRDRSHTPGAGYTERAEIKKSSASIAVQDKSVAAAGTVVLNGTFSGNADWAVVGLEIKPSSGGVVTQYELTTNVSGSGSVNPSNGTYNAGAMVTLTATPDAGYQFSGWSVDLNGSANPATITMDANKNVTATFTALPPTQYSLTVNTVGSGMVTIDPQSNAYDASTVVTLTATPDAGFQFSGWSGDLTGSTNPATITMNANKNITATFIPQGGTGSGQVVFEESRTGGASSSATVTTSASLTGVSGHLYLAAIAAKSNTAVNSVSGLGLTWTRVKAQCAGRNQTGVEVWMAQGTPSGNGTVTATLASAPGNAVIAVSRYSGVDAVNPLGNIVSGNTMGVSGVCSGGVDNNSYAFNLTTTVNGAVVYGAAAMRNHIHTPGAGFTERAEIMQSGKASVAVQDKSVASAQTGAVNGSFDDTVDWAVVAVEIKPQLGALKSAADESITANSPQPMSFQLEQNYPNPFNPGTSIRYSLPQAGEVRLTIYNIHGQAVSIPVSGFQSAGIYTFDWQAVDALGHSLPSGVYFYRLEAGPHIVTRRMTLLR